VRFTRIHVSQLSVKASVSKIKSKPVSLLVDEIVIDMEEPAVVLPPRTGSAPPPATPAPGSAAENDFGAPHR